VPDPEVSYGRPWRVRLDGPSTLIERFICDADIFDTREIELWSVLQEGHSRRRTPSHRWKRRQECRRREREVPRVSLTNHGACLQLTGALRGIGRYTKRQLFLRWLLDEDRIALIVDVVSDSKPCIALDARNDDTLSRDVHVHNSDMTISPFQTSESVFSHYFVPAFCLAHRAFCAAEIFARAAADIFRRRRLPTMIPFRFLDPFGRPGPRF
jgi:hypothetical protein